MKRHIAATPTCKQRWEKEIMDLSSDPGPIIDSKSTHLDSVTDESVFDIPNTWDDMHSFVPGGGPEPAATNHIPIEESTHNVEESLQGQKFRDTKPRRFIEAFPGPVGVPVGRGQTKFDLIYQNQVEEGKNNFSPFANDEEWGLAQWLSRRVGQKAIDEYLNLSMVSLVNELKKLLI